MQIDKSPFFRKAIIPWYDTDTACMITAVVMFISALFGVEGIKIAGQIETYNDYIWVPVLFFALSATVFATTIIRLVKRYTGNSPM